MRAGFLNRDGVAALVMLVVALGGFANVRAGDGKRPEKIEFSEAPGPGAEPVVVSNLNRLNPDPNSFKQVKEDLLRPFGSLDPQNILSEQDFENGQTHQPPRPAQPMLSKRAQELLDEKKNWAFTAYEQLNSPKNQVEKKMFGIKDYTQDGQEKDEGSVVDQYYQNLDQSKTRGPKQSAETARAEFINRNGFDPLGKSFASSDPFTKKMFGVDAPAKLVEENAGPGLLGAGGLVLGSPAEIKLQQQHLEEMREKILGDFSKKFPRAGEQNNLLLATDPNAPKSGTGMQTLFDQQLTDAAAFKQKSANPFIAADPTAKALHSHINDDLTAKALGLPYYGVKAPTNSVSRPTPTAQSVTAEWDPFGANRPKPKF